jgi:hypothetical protein
MRVLAAAFPDDASARAAKARLIAQLQLEANQIGVEALALMSGRVGPRAILAGRFREDLVGVARSVVERFGGTMVIDIDDAGRNA